MCIFGLQDRERDFIISGGWSTGDNCATQVSLSPIDTILDARFWGPVMAVDLTNSIPDEVFVGTFSISNLSFNRGTTFFASQPTGLLILGPLAPPGSVIVDNVHVLTGQSTQDFASALGFNLWGSGTLRLRNSNVSFNTLSGPGSQPAYVGMNENVVGFVSNNSIYDNSVGGTAAGLVVNNTATVSNNAVAENTSSAEPSYQFFSGAPTALTLVNNHFETVGFANGAPFSDVGTTTGDPAWTGTYVYRVPNPGSPLLDSGENNPSGGALDIDHVGGPRILNGTIDRGSIEGTAVGGPSGATVTVTKTFSDGNPATVSVSLSCEGIDPANISPGQNLASESSPAIFNVSGLGEGTTNCTATEVVPTGYTPVSATCQTTIEPGVGGGCGITNNQDPVEFLVYKTFDDGNPVASATVTLACADVDPGDIITNKGTADAGSPASFTVQNFPYGGTDCTATESVEPVGYTPLSSTCMDAISLASDGSCTLENIQDPVIIRAAKVYSNGGGGAVDFAVECTNLNTGGSVTPTDAGASPGFPAEFEVNDFMWDGTTICSVTEPTPPSGYFASSNTCLDLSIVPTDDPVDCTITNSPTRATFKVTKHFADGNNVGEVLVSIDCNTGLILDQDKLLSDGGSVEFVVTSFTEGVLACTITEDSEFGYVGEYDNVSLGNIISDESCDYPAEEIVGNSEHECVITNSPGPVSFSVQKQWVYPVEAPEFDERFDLYITCNAEIENGGNSGGDNWYYSFIGLDGNSSASIVVYPTWQGTTCTVQEGVYSDAVEADDSDCQDVPVQLGTNTGCTIVNTVFFEGIPTLSQYSLALLSLLMLGMGFAGFRRFI